MTKARKLTTLIVVLVLMLATAVLVQAQDEAEPIDIGDTVEGTLAVGERVEYRFEAEGGELLLISLSSEEYDTYVYLLDESGNELASDDDGGIGRNSIINGFEIPEAGTYIIQSAAFGDNGAGDFTLILSTAESTTIEYGQTVGGELEGLPVALYNFIGNMGDLIVVTVSGEGFDTSVELVGPNDLTLEFGNYIDGRISRLGPTELNQDGEYALTVSAEGSYTLSLERIEPLNLVVGDALTAEFTEADDTLYFALDSLGSEVVDIVVDSDNQLDTRFDLVSPFGFILDSADDGDGTVDPSLMGAVLGDTGTYYIILSPQNPNAALMGSLSVTITPAELASLDDGAVELTFDFDVNEQVVSFEAEAGEIITLITQVETESEFLSPFIEVTQGADAIVNFSQRGITRGAITFEVPETGTYNVVVQAFSEATITVEIERESSDE